MENSILQQQPISQQSIQQASPQQSSNVPSGGKFKWILLVIILLIIIGFGAYYFSVNQNKFLGQYFQKPTPTLAPTSPTPTPDPTANWKTYSSSKFGIEFKYPQELKLQENEYKNSQYDDNVRLIKGMGYVFEVSKIVTNDTIEKWASNSGIYTTHKMLESEFMGNKANLFTQNVLSQVPMDFYAIKMSNFILKISFEVADNPNFYSPSERETVKSNNENFVKTDKITIDQILYTFKFSDQNQIINKGNYFQIPELGVKFPIPSDLQGLEYSIKKVSDGVSVAYFSTASLNSLDGQNGGKYCKTADGSIGAISKIYKSELSNDANAMWSRSVSGMKTATIPTKDNPVPNAKEFIDFYILFEGPQATCSDNKSVSDLQAKQISALYGVISTVETIK